MLVAATGTGDPALINQRVNRIARVTAAYHAWRGDEGAGEYADEAGFCKVGRIADIRENGYVLSPGRYVGAAEVDADVEAIDERMGRLTTRLAEQLSEGRDLDRRIQLALGSVGWQLPADNGGGSA